MTTENVMKLGKIEKLMFSFVLLFLPMYRAIKKRNQFELNSEKCIKMHMSGPKIHIELSVISR